MKTAHTINRIRGALGEHLLAFDQPSPRRVYLEIAPETVFEASEILFAEIGARLQTASGIDTPQGIEVLYHWALDGEGCMVTVRTLVDRHEPQLESIADLCPAAKPIEREIWELLGVTFRGHPDLRHLLLDENWPGDDYPARKRHRDEGIDSSAE